MGVLELGCAKAVGADEDTDAGERFGETMRIAETGFEEPGLADQRPRWGQAEIDRDDRGSGLQRFEMGVQGPEKNLHVGGGLGQAEAAEVASVVLEPEHELDFGGNVVRGDQLARESIKKTAEDEKERLQRFDRILEFHRRGKCLRWDDGPQRADVATGGALPEGESLGTEAADDFIARQGREIAEGAQAPVFKNAREFWR